MEARINSAFRGSLVSRPLEEIQSFEGKRFRFGLNGPNLELSKRRVELDRSMIPLVDIHVHLLAGLDDGPRELKDAVRMCQDALEEGVRMMAATAHQNDQYPDVTPDRIRMATRELADALSAQRVAMSVVPCAEVMAHPELLASWQHGKLLSIGDHRKYILIEMPHGLFVDLRPIVERLRQTGIRPILAHPERHPEFLHDSGLIEEFINEGCLVQVSSSSITNPANREDERAIKRWFKRGIVHLLGSDGHSPRRRPPRIVDAYHQIAAWAGNTTADRIGSTNGLLVLQGLPIKAPKPAPAGSKWLPRLW